MACECGCGCCGPVRPEEETGVKPRAELERERDEDRRRIEELEHRVEELRGAAR